MKDLWYRDIENPTDRKNFRENVLGSKIVLDKLAKLVYNRLKSGNSDTDFENPGWAFKQAAHVGELDALKWVLTLIQISDKET